MWDNSHALFRCSLELYTIAGDICFILIWQVSNYGFSWIELSRTGITQRARFMVEPISLDHFRPVKYNEPGRSAHKPNPDLADVLNRRVKLLDDFCGFLCSPG